MRIPKVDEIWKIHYIDRVGHFVVKITEIDEESERILGTILEDTETEFNDIGRNFDFMDLGPLNENDHIVEYFNTPLYKKLEGINE